MAENWKRIPGYDKYEASDLGRVRRINTGKVLSPSKLNDDRVAYWGVCLWENGKQKRVPVHQLVAFAFIGERPEGYVIDHVDANKLNNLPENLEYVTQQENIRRALIKGLNPKISLISSETIERIKILLVQTSPYLTFAEIAQLTEVSAGSVYRVHQTLKPESKDSIKERRTRITDDDVQAILDLLDENVLQQQEIAVIFSVDNSTITRIKKGTYGHRAIKRKMLKKQSIQSRVKPYKAA